MAHCDAVGVNGSNRIFSWRSAKADDAEWMSGKSRARLALVLTEAPSWMSDRDRSRIRGREIGFVFQAFHLIPSLTVIQNVLVPSDLAHVSRKTSVPRAHHLLERVGLIHRIMHFPSELSGGEMQRVAIARSLINEPSILLCDEPTGSLDSSSGEQIMNLIRSLTKEGDRAVLMVTHDPRWGDLADKHFEMCDGRIESHPMRRCNHDSTLRAA